MPDNDFSMRGHMRKSVDVHQETQRAPLYLEQTFHLKFVHYQPVQNSDFIKFLIKHSDIEGELNSIFQSLGKMLQKYCIEVAYVNSAKIINLSTITRKITESQLIGSVLSLKDQTNIKIKQIVNIS